MALAAHETTESWTRDEIIEVLTHSSKKRLNMDLRQFINAIRSDKLDRCDFAEMIALLNLLPADDPVFKET
jgi:hypothetical protein